MLLNITEQPRCCYSLLNPKDLHKPPLSSISSLAELCVCPRAVPTICVHQMGLSHLSSNVTRTHLCYNIVLRLSVS
jgi:hypothetical protein